MSDAAADVVAAVFAGAGVAGLTAAQEVRSRLPRLQLRRRLFPRVAAVVELHLAQQLPRRRCPLESPSLSWTMRMPLRLLIDSEWIAAFVLGVLALVLALVLDYAVAATGWEEMLGKLRPTPRPGGYWCLFRRPCLTSSALQQQISHRRHWILR